MKTFHMLCYIPTYLIRHCFSNYLHPLIKQSRLSWHSHLGFLVLKEFQISEFLILLIIHEVAKFESVCKITRESLSRYATNVSLTHRDDQAHRHRRQNTLVSRCYLMWHWFFEQNKPINLYYKNSEYGS